MKLSLILTAALLSSVMSPARADAREREEPAPQNSAIASPVAIHPENWVTTSDRDGSGSNGEGTTFFELTVSSAGEVEQCRVIQSSGIAVFDHLTCSLMGKRARFRPATDQNGQAIASTWSNRVKWVKPGHDISVTPPPPAIEVMVSRLPPKISSPVSAGVLAVIGLHGEVEACTGQNIAFPAALNTLACQQLQRTMPSVIARDNKGDARRILRFFWVRFSAPTQAPSR